MSHSKTNKNLLIAIITVAVLIALYTYTSKNSNSYKNSDKTLDNALTNIVTKKKVKKHKQRLSTIEIQQEYSEPFMVDENDYRPFQLDDLLDPADRNEKSAKAIFNYNNLLEISHIMNAIRNETLSIDEISVDEIKDWVKVLIYDEYYRNAKYNNLDNTFDMAKLDEIDVSYLPREDELSERMEKGYLMQINDLAKTINQLNTESKENYLRRLSKIVKKRTNYATLFLESKASKYYNNKQLSLGVKIEFVDKVFETKDVYLINQSIDYLKYYKTFENKQNIEIINITLQKLEEIYR